MANHTGTLENTGPQAQCPPQDQPQKFVLGIVGAVAFAHLLNDSIQAVVTASYPLLKAEFSLSFAQIGWIALVYQITASLLPTWIGLVIPINILNRIYSRPGCLPRSLVLD